MQQFKSIKKTQLTIASLVLLMGSVYAEPIGNIVEHKGSATLTREEGEELVVTGAFIPDVELNDTAETENGRMLIEFLDKAELSLTENTKVYIDNVYYDPDPSKSKMTMRMAVGTARFASGRLGMVNKQNIDITTPTAQITVRGTDFTTTIDELGRSLVILLPDENGDPSGTIVVSNEGGSITLEEAYAATMVSSLDSAPTSKVVISNITPSMIDNMFIVNPPDEIRQQMEEEYNEDMEADKGILDVDFLEFNELEGDAGLSKDELEFTELDVDFLDVDFLVDLLDVVEELIRTTEDLADVQAQQGGGQFTLKNAEVGFNKDSQYNIFEQDGDVIFYRNVNGSIRLAFDIGASARIDTIVEGYEGSILLNGGDDIIVVITQSN
ncbi:MAG: hypothetical protein EBW42_02680 [Rhodobacterales bacterium]|nr:hypothetical protein [Rhodobacterales bacterium]